MKWIFAIQVVDIVNPNSTGDDAMCYKRGDVIDVFSDDIFISEKCLSNRNWRFVRMFCSKAVANMFLQEEPVKVTPNPVRQRRNAVFDLDNPNLPSDFKQFVDVWSGKIYDISLSSNELARLLKVKKSRLSELTL